MAYLLCHSVDGRNLHLVISHRIAIDFYTLPRAPFRRELGVEIVLRQSPSIYELSMEYLVYELVLLRALRNIDETMGICRVIFTLSA